MASDVDRSTEFKITFDHVYRVMLHYSNWPEDATKSVSQKVKMAVPMLPSKDCEAIVKQTFKYGLCIICTVPYPRAMLYRDSLVGMGLNASIEEA